jgi:flagellar hook-length control protein FliK
MQSVGDIKFSLSSGPDQPLRSPRNNGQEAAPADGFFTMLKDRVSVAEDRGSDPGKKIEAPKQETAPGKAEKEPTGPDWQVKEKDQTGEKSNEKAGPPRQGKVEGKKENDSKGVTKGVKDEKNAGMGKEHKTVKKSPDLKVMKAQKMKQQPDEAAAGLLEMLQKIISLLERIQDNPGAERLRNAANETLDLLKSLTKHNEIAKLVKSLDTALDKVLSLLSKLNMGASLSSVATREQVSAAIDSLKEMIAKLKPGKDQKSDQKPDQKQALQGENHPLTHKEKPNRPEPLVEGSRGESLFRKGGGEGADGGSLNQLNTAKNGHTIKLPDPGHAAFLKSGRYAEHLEGIIQAARVVVKDSKNATFSLRLHPRELGSVRISIGLLDGTVHGKFLVDTPAARDVLMADIELIKEELAQAGISVGEFQVNVSDQRERLMHESEHGPFTFALTPPAVEAETGFAENSKSYHEGYINLII